MMPLYCSQGHTNDPTNRFCKDCGQSLPLAVGRVLEKRYRIVSHLGQGGFGRTYLAEDLHRFDDCCVLKEFAPQVQGVPELAKAKELFEREAGTLHKLHHPQLPGFLGLFQADVGGGIGRLFLVQDYVEGKTYLNLLKSGHRFNETDVLQLLHQLLPVLSYLHSQGVIHRDISPDNIILRESDQLPVLIDFGGVKQVAITAISKFTNLGSIETRLGKKGYAPQEQLRHGQVFINSDLYSLAVTALVLLTGKEPQDLYDSYQGTWGWGQSIHVTPQLQAVLQKMLAHQPSDRFASAPDVLKALPLAATTSTPTSPPPTQSTPSTPIRLISRLLTPLSNPSHLRTLVVAPKAAPQIAPATPSPIAANTNPQPIPKRPNLLSQPMVWGIKVAVGTAFILLSSVAGFAVMNSVIRSIQSAPLVQLPKNAPDTSTTSSEQQRANKILTRRQALNLEEGFFNTLVNNTFYAKHPEVRGRSLTQGSQDATLRNQWYKIAEELLDKLEQAQLSGVARRKLGRYSVQDYETWKRQANRGQLGGYTIDQLTKKTDETFYRLFRDQQGEKLNLQTFGQIWYAIAADRVSQLDKK